MFYMYIRPFNVSYEYYVGGFQLVVHPISSGYTNISYMEMYLEHIVYMAYNVHGSMYVVFVGTIIE